MAKQPKKSTASAAPVTPAKKPAPKKTAVKPKSAAKPKTKAATATTTAAKKPKSAKKPATAKKPTTAKAATAIKPAAKPAKKPAKKSTTAKKPATGTPVLSLLGVNPQITSPTNGSTVPANTNLTVTVTTDDPTVSHVVKVQDITGSRPVTIATLPAAAVVTNPFSVTVPGGVLPAGRTIRITVTTDPPGTNGTDTVIVTT